MTPKDFLRCVRDSNRRVVETQDRAESICDLMNTIKRRCVSDDKWVAMSLSVGKLLDALGSQICQMVNIKLTAIDSINALDNERQKEALELYYLDGMTWEQVAEKMELSERHVKRLAKTAMQYIKVPENC